MTELWTIARVLQWTTDYFKRRDLDSPRLDAELLVADALGMDRVRLYLEHHKPLHADELTEIRARVQRRAKREPVAYITGRQGFWSLDLHVDARVLVPRPDTERLVELAVARLKGTETPRIVDVGTGSGAIALALASERSDATVMAIDRSPDALAVARANGERLKLPVAWRQGDLLAGVDGPFDLIASNPPYVRRGDLANLMPDVRQYEPRLALDGGDDGLDLIRRLIPQAAERLVPGGALLIEIGHDQGPDVRALCLADARFSAATVRLDYDKRDRVVEATRA
ncbi:MAG: peptide chain release factor N(5)-glutamine methyltransferase [Myxococcales bacterium]|nr:peptide chain release factor N(5)-glutamine methyltransferase [Myxococcales bacterium]